MTEGDWDKVVGSVEKAFSARQWVVVDTTLTSLPEEKDVEKLLEMAGEEQRRRWEGSLSRMASLQALVVGMVLRRLLAQIVGSRGSSIRFGTGAHGKPFLAGIENPPKFNVSHGSSHGLIALSDRLEIGIDAEVIGDYKERVARRILPPEEFNRLQHFEPTERSRVFYKLWTIKEACVKATGAGFSTPLNEVAVTFDGTAGRWGGAVGWQVINISEKLCAAVALVCGDKEMEAGRLLSIDALEVLGVRQ